MAMDIDLLDGLVIVTELYAHHYNEDRRNNSPNLLLVLNKKIINIRKINLKYFE